MLKDELTYNEAFENCSTEMYKHNNEDKPILINIRAHYVLFPQHAQSGYPATSIYNPASNVISFPIRSQQ